MRTHPVSDPLDRLHLQLPAGSAADWLLAAARDERDTGGPDTATLLREAAAVAPTADATRRLTVAAARQH